MKFDSSKINKIILENGDGKKLEIEVPKIGHLYALARAEKKTEGKNDVAILIAQLVALCSPLPAPPVIGLVRFWDWLARWGKERAAKRFIWGLTASEAHQALNYLLALMHGLSPAEFDAFLKDVNKKKDLTPPAADPAVETTENHPPI